MTMNPIKAIRQAVYNAVTGGIQDAVRDALADPTTYAVTGLDLPALTAGPVIDGEVLEEQTAPKMTKQRTRN